MPLSDWAACLVDSKYTGTLACIDRRSLLVPNPSLIFWFSSYYRLNLGNHHTWLITKTFQAYISQVWFLLFFYFFPLGAASLKLGVAFQTTVCKFSATLLPGGVLAKSSKVCCWTNFGERVELFEKSTFSAGKYVTNKKYRCLKQLQNFKNVDSTLNIQLLFKLLTLRWNYFNLGSKTMLIEAC